MNLRIKIVIAIAFFVAVAGTLAQNRIAEIGKIVAELEENKMASDMITVSRSMGNYNIEAEFHLTINDGYVFNIVSGTVHVQNESVYYYAGEEIVFVYLKQKSYVNSWQDENAEFEIIEYRAYFENGKVIKLLEKKFKGREGINDKYDMSKIKNQTLDLNQTQNLVDNFESNSAKYMKLFKSLYENLH